MGLLSLFESRSTQKPAAVSHQAPLYRARQHQTHYAGADAYLLRWKGGGIVVPGFVSDFVDTCRQFRPFDAHLRLYSADHEDEGAVIDTLKTWETPLVECGLLISEETVLTWCRPVVDIHARLPLIASICVPTNGQIDLAERAVRSFAANARDCSQPLDFLVVDNGADADMRERARARLRDVNQETSNPVRYSGWEEKTRFSQALVDESGCSEESIRFALFGMEGFANGGGLNRNGILLDRVGKAFVMVNDDVVCRMSRAPEELTGLGFCGEGDPLEWWFDEVEHKELPEADFVAEHERFLGKEVGECISGYGQQADLDLFSMSDAVLRRLESGPGSIRVTMMAVAGAIQPVSQWGFLALSGPSFARYTKGEASAATRAGVRRACIADETGGLDSSMGFDQRDLLPPFLPIMRGEVAVFNAVLWQCFPGSWPLHLPCAARRDSPTATAGPSDVECTAAWSMSELLRSMILAWAPAGGCPADALRGLGLHLQGMATATDATFGENLKTRAAEHVSGLLTNLERRLDTETNAPGWWRDAVEVRCRDLGEALRGNEYEIPAELRNWDEPVQSRRLIACIVRKYGELLHDWPEIAAAASKLRQRGVSFSRVP